MRREIASALALAQAVAAQVDRLTERVKELEARPRGPGRPRQENGEAQTDGR